MVQQPANVAWGVQAATIPGMPNGNAGQPQMMYTTAIPPYQTQWEHNQPETTAAGHQRPP